MDFNKNLEELRKKIGEIGADAILVAMNNFFGNFEDKLSGIGYISGFTGSNGRAIVSQNKAMLAVDGRYTKQAFEQTDNDFWEIKNYPEYDTNTLIAGIISHGQTLAIGMASITYKSYLSILSLSNKLGFKIKLLDEFPLFKPQKSAKTIYLMNEKDQGESRRNKAERIKNTLSIGESLLISDSSMIGWAFGVRIAPTEDKCVLPNCVAFIPKAGKPILFSDLELKDQCSNFEFKNISEFESVIKKFEKAPVIMDFSRTSLYFAEILQRNGFSIKSPKINYGQFEAIKNETEIQNMKIASEKASLSFIRTLAFAENIRSSSEVEIADFFENDLKKYDDFVSLSFNSISAFERNTALVHYDPKVCGNSKIDSDGLFLFDAGAHFKTATTDMTRTIYRGNNPNEELKIIYSTVLKSIINFSSMKFPDNLKSCNIDSIARFAIWNQGYDYRFGTGHGVGNFANVHEHPRVSPMSNDEITKNMVITVEPGIYRDNFGIRMENMILTKQSDKNGFVEFETLNFIPFCRKMIIKEMFSISELAWINNYHKIVFEKFADELKTDNLTFNWFKENTREI